MGGSSPKGKLGENAPAFSPGAIQDANGTFIRQSKASRGNKTKNKTGFASRTPGKRRQDRRHFAWRSPNAQDRRWIPDRSHSPASVYERS